MNKTGHSGRESVVYMMHHIMHKMIYYRCTNQTCLQCSLFLAWFSMPHFFEQHPCGSLLTVTINSSIHSTISQETDHISSSAFTSAGSCHITSLFICIVKLFSTPTSISVCILQQKCVQNFRFQLE